MKSMYRTLLLLLFTALVGLPSLATAATYGSAMYAWERGDFKTAFREFTDLSRNNDPSAQYMLGKMYADAQGTRQDYIMAYVWLHLSESAGNHQAGQLKSKIRQRMSRSQQARAMDVVNKWQQPTNNTPQPPEYLEPMIVRRVQQALKDLRYFHDRVDGIPGRKTRDAIHWYQQDQGMVADGRISDLLLDHLGIEPPSDDISELARLQKKLRKLIRKAKKRHAAEPWLIKKLEKLANVKNNPWPHQVLRENFLSKNYERGDGWQTVAGNVWHEQGKGLICKSVNSWKKSTVKHESPGAILKGKKPLDMQRLISNGQFVKIQNNIRFTNAFALKVETNTLNETDGLILSSHLNGKSHTGYRLVFQPGHRDLVKLFKVSPNARTEIQTRSSRFNLENSGPHVFEWTRARDGQMTVSVDGQRLFEVYDNSITEPFQNLGIAHMGGQVILRDIQLYDDANSGQRL